MEKEFALIEELELEIATANTRGNAARLRQLLADEFSEFGKSGATYTKEQVISLLVNATPREIEFSHFKFTRLASDAVLVTYQSSSNGVHANRSSVWLRRNAEQWQLLHHQGTVCALG